MLGGGQRLQCLPKDGALAHGIHAGLGSVAVRGQRGAIAYRHHIGVRARAQSTRTKPRSSTDRPLSVSHASGAAPVNQMIKSLGRTSAPPISSAPSVSEVTSAPIADGNASSGSELLGPCAETGRVLVQDLLAAFEQCDLGLAPCCFEGGRSREGDLVAGRASAHNCHTYAVPAFGTSLPGQRAQLRAQVDRSRNRFYEGSSSRNIWV